MFDHFGVFRVVVPPFCLLFNLETFPFQMDVSATQLFYIVDVLCSDKLLLSPAQHCVKVSEGLRAEDDSNVFYFILLFFCQVYQLIGLLELLLGSIFIPIVVQLASDQLHKPRMLHHLESLSDCSQQVIYSDVFL